LSQGKVEALDEGGVDLSAAGLAAQILDQICLAMPGVPNQGMDAFVHAMEEGIKRAYAGI
jgi:hypothetical protein